MRSVARRALGWPGLMVLVGLAWACEAPAPEPEAESPEPAGAPSLPAPLVLEPDGRFPLSARERTALGVRSPEESVELVLDLGLRVDWGALWRAGDEQGLELADRAALVRRQLAAHRAALEAAAAPVLEWLAAEGSEVGEVEALPVLSLVRCRTSVHGVRLLTLRDELRRIQLEPRELPVEDAEDAGEDASEEREDSPAPSAKPPAGASWGPSAVGAPAAWETGRRGQGTLAFLLDGGWHPEHESLSERFEPELALDLRRREGLHGTGVISAAVGRRADGLALGVAPEARWTATDPFPDGRYQALRFSRVAERVLEVEPDAVVMPWDLTGRLPLGVVQALSAWRVAGIPAFVAAGNWGPDPSSNRPPANLDGLGPDEAIVRSIGATAPDGSAYRHSARGPSLSTGRTFPWLAAPGDRLPVASEPPAAHSETQGTSFAVGVAAGAALLLREADPSLTSLQLEDLLESTAKDVGEPGPDPVFGHGLIDVSAALAELEARAQPR